jgi:hypothetical protein
MGSGRPKPSLNLTVRERADLESIVSSCSRAARLGAAREYDSAERKRCIGTRDRAARQSHRAGGKQLAQAFS